MITLRFRGPDGTQRANVNSEDTFRTLAEKVGNSGSVHWRVNVNVDQLKVILPKTVDFDTLKFASSALYQDERELTKVMNVQVSKVGLA